jgi:glycosyltransferase involved in cell wall biosynthesis
MRPTVSCICVTGKDSFHVEHFLPAAMECFLAQTYPAGLLELILVSERELTPRLSAPRITTVLAPEARTLGDLRNAGLEAACGDFCIQWDDDDWHHPERIEKQVEALSDVPDLHADRAACFLRRQLCYSFASDTAFLREFPHTYIHGTILHRNLAACRYASLAREEDTLFLDHFAMPVVLNNDPRLYLRFAHGHNTWPEEHIMREAYGLRHQWFVNPAEAGLLREVLDSRYRGVPRGTRTPSPTPERTATRGAEPR